MKTRTVCTAVLTVALLLFLGAGAEAQLPKEGTFSAVYSSFGTATVFQVGKERVLVAWEENGLSTEKGIADHLTWHCWGVGDFANGVGGHRGYCIATDPSGDQFISEGQPFSKSHAMDAKTFEVIGKVTSGTGKFAGITGTWTFVVQGPDFRPATEGTYFQYGHFEGL